MDSIAEMIRDWVQQYGPHVNGVTFKPGKVGSIGKARLLKIADMVERLERREWPTDMGGVTGKDEPCTEGERGMDDSRQGGITDELRHFANEWDWLDYKADESARRLRAIADRIDAAHEEAMQREHESAYDAGYAEHEDAMAEHGWVRLPKDGEAPCKQLSEWIEKRGLITGPLDHDGELWHKGDMSASPWGEIGSIVFDGQCWQVCGHDTSAPWLPADSLLHYHGPTVEDVLHSFICDVEEDVRDEREIIAEYAAKLRMANNEE